MSTPQQLRSTATAVTECDSASDPSCPKAKIFRIWAGKLRPPKVLRASLLLAAAASLLLFGSEARAGNINIGGPCGDLRNVPSPALIGGCTLADGTTIGPQGGSGGTSPTSFLLTISPVFVNVPKGQNRLVIYSTVAAGAPTSFKESFIELDGRVTLFKNSIITLTLQGFADGVLIDSVTETFGPGACGKANSCSKPVFKFMFGGGGTNVMLFTERLTVNITGGGSYKVSGSNPFGSVPEPTTLSLFGTGLLALVGARRRGAGPHFSRKAEITGAYLLRGLKFGKGNSGYGGQANEAIPS